jgi:hypothetical protein
MSLRDEELSQTALISAPFGSHLIISIRPPSEKTRGPKKGRANVEYLDVTPAWRVGGKRRLPQLERWNIQNLVPCSFT